MAEILFFLAAIGVMAGALGVITLRNPFYSVLALVTHLIALAALFLLLRAEFVAAAQVVVYAGAVMVLYVFVVSYVGGSDEPLGPHAGRGLKAVSVLSAFGLFAVFAIATLGSGLQAIGTEGAAYQPGFGSPDQIGELLLTRFLLPFELASFLLTIAAVGAVVLARRRADAHLGGEQRISVADLVRPEGTGTMLEGVKGTTGTPARRIPGPATDQARGTAPVSDHAHGDPEPGARGTDREARV
jgi:NADH-quinone oxidoreductase subunit J